MISFRLTAEEYDRFRELCSTSGTRSVSELACAAIGSLLKQPGCGAADLLEHRVAELEGRMHMLNLDFRRLRAGGNDQQQLEDTQANLAKR